MFNFSKAISLSSKIAQDFGILLSNKSKEIESVLFEALKVTELKEEVIIDCKLDDKETRLTYLKGKLTDREKIFIAWSYLLINGSYQEEKENKVIATTYLGEVLNVNKDDWGEQRIYSWSLPYYLISKYSLEVEGIYSVINKLYSFIKKPEKQFSDFYIELLRQEKNPVRKVEIAKIAEKFYPNEETFISVICKDLCLRKKYKECEQFLSTVKKRVGFKIWKEMYVGMILWNCHIQRKNFDKALEVLDTDINDDMRTNVSDLLKGITYVYKKKWNNAIPHLEKSIFDDNTNGSQSLIASYFLLQSYLSAKYIDKAEELIANFPLEKDELYFYYGFPIDYMGEAIKIVSHALKTKSLNETSLAKLNGMLSYLLYEKIPIAKDTGKLQRNMTNKEKQILSKSVILVRKALSIFPQNTFFNSLCSNLFLYEKKYDEAMEYKVRSMMRGTGNNDFYMEAELENCSDEFIQNYPNLFKQIYNNSDYTPDEYIKYQFESDIGCLFRKKYYKHICELFLFLESAFEDVGSIGKDSMLRDGDLFEIAYSFNECGFDDKALWLYEKKLGMDNEDSSVLNNIALIYEKKGNIKKAKEMIIKAKTLDKDGIVVARNYSRLITEVKNKETSNGGKENFSQNKDKKKELTFDDKTSEIIFGEKKCPIPFGTNQYVLCKALFSSPIGEWIKEDDVVDNFFQGKDNRRSFYDAVRLINQKAKESINVKKLIIYSSNRAQLHKELMI